MGSTDLAPTEFDLFGAIEPEQNLSTVTADQIMNKGLFCFRCIDDRFRCHPSHLGKGLIKQEEIVYSVTRHDLLRAHMGLRMGIEV